jgi:hypothetical protein
MLSSSLIYLEIKIKITNLANQPEEKEKGKELIMS